MMENGLLNNNVYFGMVHALVAYRHLLDLKQIIFFREARLILPTCNILFIYSL